jgi:site-specific DNA-methyltransferase (adenine-specific)
MEITNKKLNELIPYEKNPRSNDQAVKYVANSISNFGFKVPIVIDKENIIVCGHTRYKAAKRLKYKFDFSWNL